MISPVLIYFYNINYGNTLIHCSSAVLSALSDLQEKIRTLERERSFYQQSYSDVEKENQTMSADLKAQIIHLEKEVWTLKSQSKDTHISTTTTAKTTGNNTTNTNNNANNTTTARTTRNNATTNKATSYTSRISPVKQRPTTQFTSRYRPPSTSRTTQHSTARSSTAIPTSSYDTSSSHYAHGTQHTRSSTSTHHHASHYDHSSASGSSLHDSYDRAHYTKGTQVIFSLFLFFFILWGTTS